MKKLNWTGLPTILLFVAIPAGTVEVSPGTALSNGKFAETERNWKVAAAWYRKAMGYAETGEHAQVGLATALIKTGEKAEAAELLKELIEKKNPFNPDARLSRADLLIEEGDVENALAETNLALQLHPKYPNAIERLARIKLSQNKPTEALQFVQTALSQPECPSWVRWTRAKIYLSLKDGEAARKDLADLISERPHDVDYRLDLAEAYAILKKPDLLEGTLQHVVRLNPRHEKALERLANLAFEQRRGDDASGYFTKLMSLYPEKLDIPVRFAKQLDMSGQSARAEDVLLSTLKIKANFDPAAQTLVDLYVRQGRIDKAGTYLNGFTEQFSSAQWAKVAHAKLFQQIGKVERAEAILNKVSFEKAESPEGALLLAKIKMVQKKPKEALEAVARAEKAFPKHAELLFQLASLSEQAGNVPAAISYYNRLEPGSPSADQGFLNVATIYEKMGQVRESIQALSKISKTSDLRFNADSKLSELRNRLNTEERKPASIPTAK